jgi:hypothetical protein
MLFYKGRLIIIANEKPSTITYGSMLYTDAPYGSKLHLKDSVGAKKGSLHIQEANRRDQQSLDVIP